MPQNQDHLLHLYDKEGRLRSVVISAELWLLAKDKLRPVLDQALQDLCPSAAPVEPIAAWRELEDCWDFKYPFNAEVECHNCGTKTADWEADAPKLFRLKNANLGGLAVFECLTCGASVRKKHFKDHICYEFTPSTDSP